jgi:signal transduction histidine kinase
VFVKRSLDSLYSSFYSPILRRVILAAFIPTIVVFTMFSANQFWSNYHQGKKDIDLQIRAQEKAVHKQLENSLWGMDREAVNEIVKVISENPNIAWVKLEGADISAVEVKPDVNHDWSTLEFPLKHEKNNKSIQIGKLKIGLTKSKFLSDFSRIFYYSLLQNMVLFFSLAGCLTWIMNKKIIRPVRKINELTNRFNVEHLSPILGSSLAQDKKIHRNEIENLYTEIKLLQDNSKAAFEIQKKTEEDRFKIEIENEKQKQRIQLSQRLETIGQMTAQVAHDFANLLMIINGKANLLEKIVKQEDEIRHIEAIRKATARATSLVKKILSLTRIQSPEPIELEPFQSILDMQDLLKISIGVQNELRLQSDGSHNRILVEASTFENAIINLCVNARDAMPGGGTITIDVKRTIRSENPFVSVSISDTGTGIPEEIQLKILEPFFTTKGQGKGTGLGLAQVNDFVKQLGGNLEIHSSSNGSCFTLLVPCKVEKETLAA